MSRPVKHKEAKEMQKLIDAYFSECEVNDKPPTVAGLAYTLDLTRQGVLEYADKDEFSDTIKKAKLRIEANIEAGLMKGLNATGCIFNLKNNFGWKDKTELEHSGGIDLSGKTDAELQAIIDKG